MFARLTARPARSRNQTSRQTTATTTNATTTAPPRSSRPATKRARRRKRERTRGRARSAKRIGAECAVDRAPRQPCRQSRSPGQGSNLHGSLGALKITETHELHIGHVRVYVENGSLVAFPNACRCEACFPRVVRSAVSSFVSRGQRQHPHGRCERGNRRRETSATLSFGRRVVALGCR